MRFEPNINLAITKDGTEYRTAIVEVKNLNSFRALQKSVDYEVQRQLHEFMETGKVMESGNKSTRGWDDEKQVTVLQREKEESSDYRYFPDPDLVPVELDEQWFDKIRERLCELPLKKQLRYVDEYKLSDYDARVLTADRDTAEFFDEAIQAGGEPKRVCNWISQDGLRLANERGCKIRELGITPQQVVELTNMIVMGDVSSTAATTISDIIVTAEDWDISPREIAESHELIQKSDAGELEVVVDEVLAANEKAVADAKADGKKSKKAIGFLLGQVMQKTRGQANPKIVSQILTEKLKA